MDFMCSVITFYKWWRYTSISPRDLESLPRFQAILPCVFVYLVEAIVNSTIWCTNSPQVQHKRQLIGYNRSFCSATSHRFGLKLWPKKNLDESRWIMAHGMEGELHTSCFCSVMKFAIPGAEIVLYTPPITNMEPKNWWLVDVSHFARGYVQVPC